MANKPLRAYMLEIEGLIESGRLEETISHCRYILQSFPKHVDTYRLMGKVFLEAKQFSNAADILQRVLSAVPDDFVSHVGMSIIREDEGNLDAAIWHMERAFESQPANKAIQDELRRLFGRRDGVEPPKIRLTRGALARMYAKGNLFDQAIAELRGALSEDPQRSDLQSLLAQMNYLSGNRVEAVEASSNLLKKFPYCLAANRILAVILPQTERSEDAKVYQQRAFSLDPYLTKAGADALTSVDVPDNAVMIETLEIKPGQPTETLTEQPAWAASLGIKLDHTEEEELPDWLTADLAVPSYEGEQTAPFVDEEMETAVTGGEKEELIPTWMKESGWQPSKDESGSKPSGEEIDEFPQVEGEIEKAEIPDWLKDIAKVEDIEEESTVEAISENALPPWLEENPPGPTDSIISWLGERDEGVESLEIEAPVEAGEGEIPTWLKELGEEKELEAEGPMEAAAPSLEELESTEIQEHETGELPEWLTETTAATGVEPVEIEELVGPDTTEPIEEQVELVEEFKGEIIEEPASKPEWLQEIEPEASVVSTPEELVEEEMELPEQPAKEVSEEEIEIPDWLKDLAVEVEGEPLFEEAGGEPGEIPEWLQELGEKPEEVEITESLETEITLEPLIEPEELPTPEISEEQNLTTGQAVELDQEMQDSALAWLESLAAKQGVSEEELITKPEERLESPPEWILEEEMSAEQEVETAFVEETSMEMEADAVSEEELPDWLKEIEETEGISEIEIKPPKEGEETGELPAWLRELKPDEAESLEPSVEGAPEEGVPLSDEDAGLAWLESLAEKQGAAEEELITPPEDRTLEPPAWVSEEIDDIEKSGEISLDEELRQEIHEDVPASDELKAWMVDTQERGVPFVGETYIPPETTYEQDMIVDLNSGTLSELENIPGVGFVLAQNIVVYRDEHGPFKDLEELKQVPGVDDFSYEFIKDRLSIQPQVFMASEEAPIATPVLTENEQLLKARNAMEAGDYDGAFEAYDQLIKQSQNLNEVISLLEDESSQKPDNLFLWQSLGDAYMKNDQFQKALEAYTKAEKLL